MSLITVTSLSKSFGPVDLFAGLNFSVARGARLALVGPNGVGKTTLLRILVGKEEASSGTVASARGVRIGYLPQEADFEMQGTLWGGCEAVFADIQRQQEELHRLEALMVDPARAEEVMERYGTLQQAFEHRGGYTYQTRIRQVLSGLGFDSHDYALELDHLSGGQRTRAFLARLLLSDPDLLLLDEPTNHLDMAAVEWLESYLAQWDGAAIIVSHDRYFLDKVCNVILEMLPGGCELYHGNYSAYLHQRQERAGRRQEVFEREKEKLLKDVEYIKKNISGQNVTQAKGKLRRLTRMVQAIEQVGMEAVLNTNWSQLDVETTTSPFSVEEAERRVRALRSPVRALPELRLNLRASHRSGNIVIRTRGLEVGYPADRSKGLAARRLFYAPDIELRRLECAALIGPNGAGKTTFLKTILGQLEPLAGEVELGASLRIGYFAQAHEGLNPHCTLLEEIGTLMPGWLPGQIRDYLGKYLFAGDDVYKKVAVLSGGERGRLALAKLALQDTNLLLLDEPTNHLDIPSQEILQSVLDKYEGTILLVTHDRYLIDALATQIWEVSEGALTVFQGTYSQMKEASEKEAARQAEQQATQATPNAKRSTLNTKSKEERRKIARLQELENQIAALERQLAELGAQLESPPADAAEVARLGEAYALTQREMDERLGEWERLQEG
ncbi:MAG: ABC-F family ATP-binding cassette domain-containing protein [Anaerolineales bacterium]